MQSKEAVAEHRAGGEQITCGSREHDTNCVAVLQDRKKKTETTTVLTVISGGKLSQTPCQKKKRTEQKRKAKPVLTAVESPSGFLYVSVEG